MNYKVVNVFTGYAENSIQDIELESYAYELADFADSLGNRLVMLILDGGEHGDESEVREFFGFATTVEIDGGGEVGVVSNGEENILVIVPEGHGWYDRVKYDMDEEVYDEWVEYVSKINDN